jgi:hypothetical protein
MQVGYEFLTRPENGMIRIPEKYKNRFHSDTNVIVSVKEVSSVKDLLIPPTLDTRGWKFDRGDGNER